MTETAARLRRLGLPHARARAGAILVSSAGVAFAIAAAGMMLAPRVSVVLAAWAAILGVVGAAGWAAARAGAAAAPPALGRLVEQAAGTRSGSVQSTVAPAAGRPGASADLFALADCRAARIVEQATPLVRRALTRETRRALAVAAGIALAGAALFVAASPATGRAAFWHPLRTLRDARAPVRVLLDRATVRRGDSVTVTIEAPAATRAVLWTRGPGEPWRGAAVALDSAGRALRRVGPLETDLYVKAASGARTSAVRRVTVALPAFVAALELTARYPAYLARADEPLVPGADTVPIPAGTEILTSGSASVALARAAWSHVGRAVSRLAVEGARFSGRLLPAASGTWRLDLAAADGGPLEGAAPELELRVIPDSAPVVLVPVPGRDTTLPLSLRQPLVVDARDDHGLSRLELVSWRVSRTGKTGQPLRQPLDVSGVGERAIVQGDLDATARGLLPGDTLRLRVDAWDNAPVPHRGQSAEYALRLPSLEELRAATREAAQDAAAAADSLAAEQRALGERTGTLAQERSRDAATGGARTPPSGGAQAGTLPFQATERAEALAREQEALQQRVRELAREVAEIARAAHAAGIDDTAFQARLREVQQLLQRAISPELEQRLRDLQRALARLDPEAMRQALQRLAEAQQQLRAELERSGELFRRAAVEGALASLAADAEELKQRQAEWNGGDAPRADTAAAQGERALAARADSLAQGIAQAAQDLAHATNVAGTAPGAQPLARSQEAAGRAHRAMGQAAGAAAAGDPRAAGTAGAEAETALAEITEALRARRDSLVQAWREETLAALDQALSETAALARRQQQVAETLERGEGGAATRSRQASVEEGTAMVERHIREAAGRHALVSPQLERALGFAERQMAATREQLEQGEPNTPAAAALAGEAVDALNATALALARSRGQVAGARSGTGFAEAVEQLARLAEAQRGLNGQAQGLLPVMGLGGQAVLEQLRALATRQRALAEQLERLQAEGASAAAGPLAEEARELARQFEAGRLDRQTLERQSRLYRRLLDAGRSLTGPEPDEQQERVSRPAIGDSVRLPGVLAPGATGAGPRLRYPTWEGLAPLTPEQRRLVLEYFRLINAPQH
ncbi:MAG: hypothetical protein DMD47_06125 [Gemmatimonadetes bacterium]|nr:MAG: hypothetical protein DMD47_06125 [Gemmatimonadota bacterium]